MAVNYNNYYNNILPVIINFENIEATMYENFWLKNNYPMSYFVQVLQPVSRPGTSSWQQAGESSPYDTSLSYYESARGTGGRGTPPPRAQGQPRLDDLFRQLQVNIYQCTYYGMHQCSLKSYLSKIV